MSKGNGDGQKAGKTYPTSHPQFVSIEGSGFERGRNSGGGVKLSIGRKCEGALRY